MRFKKFLSAPRSARLVAVITAVTVGSLVIFQQASSETQQSSESTSVLSASTVDSPDVPVSEETTDSESDQSAQESSSPLVATESTQSSSSTNTVSVADTPAATAQDNDQPQVTVTEPEQPIEDDTPVVARVTQFTKGGYSQDGSVVGTTSLASETLPAGTCTYGFYDRFSPSSKVSYTNRSVERGCTAQVPVSLFPHSSDYWVFDNAGYIADDGSVVIYPSTAPSQNPSWDLTVVKNEDAVFLGGQGTINSHGTLSIFSQLQTAVPGVCTYTIYFENESTPDSSWTSFADTTSSTGQPQYHGDTFCTTQSISFADKNRSGNYRLVIDFSSHDGYHTSRLERTFSTVNYPHL